MRTIVQEETGNLEEKSVEQTNETPMKQPNETTVIDNGPEQPEESDRKQDVIVDEQNAVVDEPAAEES